MKQKEILLQRAASLDRSYTIAKIPAQTQLHEMPTAYGMHRLLQSFPVAIFHHASVEGDVSYTLNKKN